MIYIATAALLAIQFISIINKKKKSLFPPAPIQSPPATHKHPNISQPIAGDKMKARAGESTLTHFFFFFTFLEIVIQQQGRAVFIECNLFMVMAWEKKKAPEPSYSALRC